MDISIIISIFGAVVALISLYYSRFKIGNVRVLPLRYYFVEPLNSQGRRLMNLVASITFVNSGAAMRAINDLRIRICFPEAKDDLILYWRNEYPKISIMDRIEGGELPKQPTLSPYSSINRAYGFRSEIEGADLVDEMEKHETPKTYDAYVELFSECGKWTQLYKFKIEYNGRIKFELDYSKINA